MPSILGFAGAAASVVCHLRDVVCRDRTAARHWNAYDDLATRAQQRIVPRELSDMVGE
jgi:hypothetical protein